VIAEKLVAVYILPYTMYQTAKNDVVFVWNSQEHSIPRAP